MLKRFGFMVFLCCLSVAALAQTDEMKLSCVLNEKMEAAPAKGPNSIGAKDLKAVWVSKADTIAKACTDGLITVILHDGDGTWQVLFTHEEYTFWYSGLSVLLVDKGQKIKQGAMVGYVRRGEKVVLQMMDSETSVDPKEFLECGR